MKIRHLMATLLACLGAGILPASVVHADSVLYDGVGLIEGQQASVQSFNITSPGTLTVSLNSVPWLDTVSDLSFFVSSTTGVIGPSMATGVESMSVSPGTLYAHWFGDADGAYGLGAYSMRISFQPSAAGSVVPLPASLLLLLSGLGVLFGWQRRERSSAPAALPTARSGHWA